jgi:hypothetical protein
MLGLYQLSTADSKLECQTCLRHPERESARLIGNDRVPECGGVEGPHLVGAI